MTNASPLVRWLWLGQLKLTTGAKVVNRFDTPSFSLKKRKITQFDGHERKFEKGWKSNLFGGKEISLQSNPVSHKVRMACLNCLSFVVVAAMAVAFAEAGVRGGGRRHAALFNETQHPSKKTAERHGGRRTQNIKCSLVIRRTSDN